MPEPLPFEVPKELHEAWIRHPEIVKLGDPILTQVAKPIIRYTDDVRNLIDRMIVIMREAHGLGLAAPQVGVSSRLLIYDSGDGLRVLINPKIVSMRGEQTDPPEGCLSIPGLQGVVARANEIRVKAYDERGRPVARRASGLEARVIQHEVDHLDGILFYTKAAPDTLEWQKDDPDEPEDATRE